MKLNHTNLVVADVHATTEFFTRHFGFTVREIKGDVIAVLEDGYGLVFNLMTPAKGEDVSYSRNFHIGFFVSDEAQVHALHAEVTAAGHEAGPVRANYRVPGGALGFYCMSPGQFYVEVATTT
ncbi:MAG TPA: VOC family protein [Devosia sp.]